MIPDWIIEYDKKNYQSSAGRAIRVLLEASEDFDTIKANFQHAQKLLMAAKCPTCDGSGTMVTGFQDDPQPEQCQWCDEKNKIIML